MNIKVKVPHTRKCPASIDVLDKNLAVLSFGDLETPDNDVEIEFTLEQMKELKKTVDKSIEDWEKNLEDFMVEGKTKIDPVHRGHC